MRKIETTIQQLVVGRPEEFTVLLLKQKMLGKEVNLPLDKEREILFRFPVWHDPERPRSEDCRCPNRLSSFRCVNPKCNKRFRPRCMAELFCCLDCYLNSDFDRIAGLILNFEGNIKVLREYINKIKYRATDKGKKSRQREYEKRNKKRAAEKNELIQNASASQVEIFNPPIIVSLDESIAALFPNSEQLGQQCRRVGCTARFFETTINGVEKHYCSEECRNHEKKQRRKARSEQLDSSCPIAAYVKLILAILRF